MKKHNKLSRAKEVSFLNFGLTQILFVFMCLIHASAQNSPEIHCPDNLTVRANPGAQQSFVQVPLPEIKVAPDSSVLYGHDTGGNLFILDLSTFQRTNIGISNVFSSEAEINSNTGKALLLSSDGGLYEINLKTAQTRFLMQLDERIQALEWINDTLFYGNTAGEFGILDPISGTITQLADFPAGFGGLAYDQENDILYASACCNRSTLYAINRKNLTVATLGGLSITTSTIEFGPDGFIYAGTNRNSSAPGIYRVNPQTRVASRVSSGDVGTGVTGLMLLEKNPVVSFSNDYTNQEDASANYPLGKTEVTYTLSTDGGDTATCSFTVEVLPALEVSQFAFWDMTTNQPVSGLNPLSDGAKIQRNRLPTLMNIRAATIPAQVGSVSFNLSGAQTINRLENIAPYDLFGDQGGQLPAGIYTLIATPYTQTQGQGSAGTPLRITFEIVESPKVTQVLLVDADQDQLIQALTRDAIIQLNPSPATNYTMQALTQPGKVGSVSFSLTGFQNVEKVENLAPYTLFGDNGATDFQGKVLSPGQYRLKANAFSLPNKGGESGAGQDIDFLLVRNNSLYIPSIVLVDAQTDRDVRTLHFRDTISLELVGAQISLRANPPANNSVKSVRIELFDAEGNLIHRQIESLMPWALFGDDPQGNYNPWTPENGDYLLVITPFSERGAQGQAGIVSTYQFKIMGEDVLNTSPPSSSVEIYPNPWQGEELSIRYLGSQQGLVTIELLHPSGNLIKQLTFENVSKNTVLTISDTDQVQNGLYYLRIKGDGILETRQVLKY